MSIYVFVNVSVMEPIVDICFNPTSKAYAKDLDDVMARTRALNVSTVFASSGAHDMDRTVELAKEYDQWCTVGVHPHWAGSAQDDTYHKMMSYARTTFNVIAIGECGLDYNRMRSPKKVQLTVFRRQMALAQELNLPVLLHSRDAHADFMTVVREYPNVVGVVHCFTGTGDELGDYLEHGFYIGFTTLICQDGSRGVNNVLNLRSVSPERIFLETDAPYMTPPVSAHDSKILHGRRNEPWTVQYALKTAADCHKISRVALAERLRDNFSRLFTRGIRVGVPCLARRAGSTAWVSGTVSKVSPSGITLTSDIDNVPYLYSNWGMLRPFEGLERESCPPRIRYDHL